MRKINFEIPTKISEVEPFLRKHLLDYSNWGALVFLFTFADLVTGFLGEASQSDQRWTLFVGLVIFLWISFIVFTGNSANLVNRNWWAWMIVAFFLPMIAAIAAVIFRTSKPKLNP